MKYYVKYRVTCECVEEVEANTPEEAARIADGQFFEREIKGVDEVEDTELVYVEDETGKMTEYCC